MLRGDRKLFTFLFAFADGHCLNLDKANLCNTYNF